MTRALQPELPILLVDDEEHILLSYRNILHLNGLRNVICCQDSRRVMGILAESAAELILLDLTMPNVSGEELLEKITLDFPEIPVIVVTGNDLTDTIVNCMKIGAVDYITKPIEPERIITSVRHALETRDLYRNNKALSRHFLAGELDNPSAFASIITQDAGMLTVFRYIEAIAGSSQTALVTGETGVGKELIARSIHEASHRTGPFVAINVAGLDDHVFSDTLFGHKKGAFTGATENRNGAIREAAGGTLFLDEIGDLSMTSQVKLLRLLQEHEYTPLGHDRPIPTDARFVVATNQDLLLLQTDGRFRKDLYYRLKAHHIQVPSLRNRKGDLPLLLNHFLNKAAESMTKRKPTPPREILDLLGSYDFPGNVRELEGMVLDAVSNHRGKTLSMRIFKAHIAQHSGPGGSTQKWSNCSFEGDPLPTIKEAKELLIREALKRAGGNKSLAAEMLGVSRQSLSNWN